MGNLCINRFVYHVRQIKRFLTLRAVTRANKAQSKVWLKMAHHSGQKARIHYSFLKESGFKKNFIKSMIANLDDDF